MKALLIISHGSRREESNDEVRKLANKIANKKSNIDKVGCAFLSLSEPTIEKAVSDLVQEGALEIIVFPFFLSAGNHVAIDIPEIIKNEEQKYTGVNFKMVSHLGVVKGVSDIIIDEVNRA
jgi:sirohydrochlorin ferrochelatase